MGKKILIAIISLVFSLNAISQQLNYFYVDSATYAMYLNGDWKDLIKLGKKSNRNDIDFYYLDLRMGHAYFERGNYFKATKYFEKAYKINPDYQFTQMYLYYSYLYSGLEKQSLTLYDKYYNSLKNDIKISKQKLKGFDVELGISPNFEYNSLQSFNYLRDFNHIAYTYLERNTSNFKLGLDYQLSSKLFLYQNIELTKDSYNIIKQTDIFSGAGLNVGLSTFQFRLNGIFSYNLGRKYLLNFNYNLVAGSIRDISEDYLTSTTASRWIYSYSFGYYQFSTGLSLFKRIGMFDFKPHVDFFHTYYEDYLYSGVDVTFYPLNNTDLYIKGSVNYSLLDDLNKPLYSSEVGLRLGKIRFYGIYYNGDIFNFIEEDGLYTYNSSEKITNLFGGGLSFPGKANNTFYFTVLPTQMEYKFYNYTSTGEKTEYFNSFTKVILKTGIKWKI